MKNMRHYKRYAVKCSGFIIDGSLRHIRFHVNDISAGGMNIDTDKEIKDAHALTIHFDFTGMLLPHAKELRGIAVRKKVRSGVFNYSICFLNLTRHEIVELDEYLRYAQNHPLSTFIPSEDTDEMAHV